MNLEFSILNIISITLSVLQILSLMSISSNILFNNVMLVVFNDYIRNNVTGHKWDSKSKVTTVALATVNI